MGDKAQGGVVGVVWADGIRAFQAVGPFVEAGEIEVEHFVEGGSGDVMFQQGGAGDDAVAAVIVVAIRQPDEDVIALAAVRGHDEDDVDLFCEAAVPLLAKGFGEPAAGPEVDAGSFVAKAVDRIDFGAQIVEDSDVVAGE